MELNSLTSEALLLLQLTVKAGLTEIETELPADFKGMFLLSDQQVLLILPKRINAIKILPV